MIFRNCHSQFATELGLIETSRIFLKLEFIPERNVSLSLGDSSSHCPLLNCLPLIILILRIVFYVIIYSSTVHIVSVQIVRDKGLRADEKFVNVSLYKDEVGLFVARSANNRAGTQCFERDKGNAERIN